MKYEISKATAPAMPNLDKGIECIKILLSKASKDMYKPFVLMFFPLLVRTSAMQNFSIPTVVGRKYAV